LLFNISKNGVLIKVLIISHFISISIAFETLPLVFLRERKYTTLFNLKNNSFSFFLTSKPNLNSISKRSANIQLLLSYETFI